MIIISTITHQAVLKLWTQHTTCVQVRMWNFKWFIVGIFTAFFVCFAAYQVLCVCVFLSGIDQLWNYVCEYTTQPLYRCEVSCKHKWLTESLSLYQHADCLSVSVVPACSNAGLLLTEAALLAYHRLFLIHLGLLQNYAHCIITHETWKLEVACCFSFVADYLWAVHTHARVCMHLCVCVCVRACMHACVHACIHLCVHAHAYVCVCLHTFVWVKVSVSAAGVCD